MMTPSSPVIRRVGLLLGAAALSLGACASGTLTATLFAMVWTCSQPTPVMDLPSTLRATGFALLVISPVVFVLAFPIAILIGTPVMAKLRRGTTTSLALATVTAGIVGGVAYSWLLSRSAPSDLMIGALYGGTIAAYHVLFGRRRR